jgi:hypothetical protein
MWVFHSPVKPEAMESSFHGLVGWTGKYLRRRKVQFFVKLCKGDQAQKPIPLPGVLSSE